MEVQALEVDIPKTGTVAFKVINKGKIGHDFKIAGKKTKLLNPGKSQTITVKFGKKGRFAYLCTVKGHAALGMKGSFSVATKPVTTSTSTLDQHVDDDDDGDRAGHDGQRQHERVRLRAHRERSAGDLGAAGHDHVRDQEQRPGSAQLRHLRHHAGAIISPGQTDTWTVGLATKAAGYLFQCDVPFHADRGMVGLLNVT